MKGLHILLILGLVFCAQIGFAQVSEKTYEITVTLTDEEGNTEVKEMLIKGDMSQKEIDDLIQEQISGADGEVDINVNVNVIGDSVTDTSGKQSKTITKIRKQRNNLSDEEKIIIEEHDMEIEVKGDKVFINGEEVKEGDFGDKKIRIMKFEEGDDFDLESILEGEEIEIGEGEKIFFIEREESSEGLAFLGVTTGSPQENGLPIRSIVKGSSAEKMGLQKNDVVISIDGKKITNFESLSKVVKSYLPGESVKLIYVREGETQETTIELSDYAKFNRVQNDFMRGRRKRNHVQKVDVTKPSLGVILQGGHKESVVIDKVLVGSAAEKAGLKSGDIITKLDKADILSNDQAIATIKAHKIGDEIKIKVLREGKKKTMRATLQKATNRQRGLENNTSNTIERIIIKERKEEDARSGFETGGAIKLRDFDLSPNPSDGEITVQFSMDPLKSNEVLTVRIVGLDGKVVVENALDKFDGRYNDKFDLSNLSSGIYLFQAEKNGQTFTKRFVLKQK